MLKMSAKNASSIQVCIKVRPCEPGLTSLWQVKEGRSIQLVDSHAEPCVFDYVFDEGANNQEVFDRMAKHIVHACMQGFNGTIFAYGQTSSGKTYTMMGDGQNPGVMVLAAKEIFQQISSETERDFLLRVGYIEIYNEKIYDLLNKKNQDLKIHEAGNGIVNVNCEECIITSEDDLLRLLCMGNKERTVGETNMNERSSRSHAIFRIIIESRKSDPSDDDAVIQSVLNLVDLAGSERADQTGARGARLKEGGHINKSLLFLSNVIKSLSENVDNKFISFRDSKLTRILQASLGGNALTSIICTIKPSIMEESQSTLSFATRAKKIRIKPQVNEMVSDATMMKRLEREIKMLKDKLAEEERKNESQLKVQDLERRIKRDMHKIISSTSLSDNSKQKRRRTWCPAASGPELETSDSTKITDDRLVPFSKASHLPKPVFFPNSNVGKRWDNIPKTINILRSLDIGTTGSGINEEFLPADCIDFGSPRLDVQKAMLTSRQLPDLSLTPIASQMGPATLEKIKKEVHDLQMFTSLEKHFEVECEEVQGLKEKLVELTAQRDQLEQDSLAEKERCDSLEEEVTNLKAVNQAANLKIEEQEVQLSALKQTITKLEVENRDAVSLEFEFEAHKKSSKLRVNDLLSALAEKDSAIEKLQKSLDDLSRDVLGNTKEDLMRSMCPKIQSSEGQTCDKCEELEEKLADLESKNDACECDQLREELVATRAQMESIQSNYEVSKTAVDECERLSNQLSTAQNDFGLLQDRYSTLEQKCQDQQLTIGNLQTEHDVVLEKNQKLQEEYKNLKLTSSEECERLQADNTKFQAEIKSLEERVKETQTKLEESKNSETLAEDFKAKNQELKAQISELDSNFKELQKEYDCLSNDLMESVQENDALREELKQRPNICDLESMRSSGMGTECSEPNPDCELLQQFVRLSESIEQIELHHHSGGSRLFRAHQMQQGQDAPGLKLCLHSAEYIERDMREQETSDSVCLKGFLKRHRFQIMQLNQEQVAVGEEARLLGIISQLEQEIEEKSALMEATEATINEMREQMTSLESALLEKSVIVNKVEDYQRQIESLEKQNAEITMVYEELQDKVIRENSVRETSMSENLLQIPAADETLSAFPEYPTKKDSKEVVALKASIEELTTKVCNLKAEIESQVSQLQLKDGNIAKLQSEFEEMSERCLSMEVKLAELEADTQQKQDLLDRQAQKLSEDLRLIDSLQEKNAQLVEQSIKAESQEKEEPILLSEYEALKESLKEAKEELSDMKMAKDDEINALQLDFLTKIEVSEGENRAKFRAYTLELKETKERYENQLATLKEELLHSSEKLSSLRDRDQAELEALKATHQERITQLEEERNSLINKHHSELENLRETLSEKQAEAETQKSKIEACTTEISELKVALEKDKEELEEVKNSLEEMKGQKSAMADRITVLEETKAEQDLALNKLQMEKTQLEEQLQLLKNLEKQANNERLDSLMASANEKIHKLQKDCKQHVLELEQLKQEKMSLQSEIQDANAQHLSTLNKLEELETQIDVQKKLMAVDKLELKEKNQTLTDKINDLTAALHEAELKSVALKDLTSQEDRLKRSLSEAKELSANLEQKVNELNSELLSSRNAISSQSIEIEQLRMELTNALDAKTSASTEQLILVNQLKEVEEKLNVQGDKFDRDVVELKGSCEELRLKLRSVQEVNGKLAIANDELVAKLKNSKNLKQNLEEEQQLCASLKENLAKLEKSKSHLEEQIQSRVGEVDKITKELNHELDSSRNTVAKLTMECGNLRSDLETKCNDFKREKETLNMTISDLQKNKKQLEEKLANLKEKEESNSRVMAQLASNEAAMASLRETLTKNEKTLEAANNKNREMGQKVDELTSECNKLRSDLQSKEATFQTEKMRLDNTISKLKEEKRSLEEKLTKFEELSKDSEQLRLTLKSKEAGFRTEKDRMDGTISSLLEDKRNLEEKLCEISDIVAKLESELTTLQGLKGNGSFESSASNGSPLPGNPRKSLDHNHGPRKSISSDTEIRRNRRISVHDERRKSYWNDVREFGTMTDPVDNNCQCTELNNKLQECQRELFIRESQVTALNMELKHHPLKDENAQLKKRIQEEQEKARFEQKRLKTKLQDLNAKIHDLTNAKSVSGQVEQATKSIKPALVTSETQTESTLEEILEKTNGKYQDALRLLRSRYNLIRELEDKLKQNENDDTSNITSLTAGQNSALKAQCEIQKKELAAVKNKYESAKRVLMMRKDEMDVLRERLAKYEPVTAAK
ncbi:LOW QUALITY PROTEIN: kinesin-like protein KIN-7O [Drosophila ficusphila]|uniref:LOW QUALITY PROTEIN: kinesin-like protein KIN-7O n=1 Tax=Drosophila ficusphila TaxID=30025 RepID=UPI001C898965|nr:LOW QUALITY PROTEIN: kinesin-like protein KIN-7O [Drosophila ficusphila]